MQEDVKQYVKTCPKSQSNKSSRMMKMPMVLTDTESICIMTFQDDFSKYIACVAIPVAEANTVAKEFSTEIIARLSIPQILVTDNSTNFVSKVFSDARWMLGMKKRTVHFRGAIDH